ncbi:hypothetical protein ABZ578_00005, partial [Streptomyces sp. NPDC013489]
MNERPDENAAPEHSTPGNPAAAQVNHYNGPVFHGTVSQGQFAWDNGTRDQTVVTGLRDDVERTLVTESRTDPLEDPRHG